MASRPEQLATHPELRGCCRATCRATAVDSRARAAARVRRDAVGARFAHRRVPPCCWCSRICTGPIGRAGISWCSCCRGSPRNGWSCWPPTAPTTCTGATRCGRCCPSWCACPPSSGWSWRRWTRATRSTSCGGSPTAACPSRCCAAPPSAARATRSSPRSWSRPRPTGCRTGWPRCSWPASRGCRPPPSRCCGWPRSPGAAWSTSLLAAVSELPDDELEQALRDAVTHHVLVADTGRRRCLRVPARAAARGDLHRAAARRAQQAARPLRQAARRAGRRGGRGRRARPPRDGRARPAARARPPRCGRRGRPIGAPPPPRCCCTPSARWSCGTRCPTPSGSPA